MPAYRYSSSLPEFHPIRFGDDDLRGFGEAGIASVKSRIAQGLNVNDLPARPLSKAFARQKQRLGKAPVRDWNFTGTTLAGLRVLSLGNGVVSFGLGVLTDPRKSSRLAASNQGENQMMGLSPSDRRNVGGVMQLDFSNKVEARRG